MRNYMRNFIYQRTATFMLLASSGCFLAVAVAWYLGENTTVTFFTHLHDWQQQSRWWLDVPQFSNFAYLFLPTIILLLVVHLIMVVSPQPRTWSRAIIIGIILAITIRYLLWRSLSTLNLSNSLDGIFSLGFFFMELTVIFSSSLQAFFLLKSKPRSKQAERLSVSVIEGKYRPNVDILIPTYNESITIIRRTIIGCQALDYPNKKIYLLDDGKREEIGALTAQLDCEYIIRDDNRYAKAGNLNHALAKTEGELIVVFDADFVPNQNFLTRTVGFFQNSQIALVQTHQSFYNADPVARNLELDNILPQDVEIFSRYYQLLRDGLDTALCYGSSFVVRRNALEEIGGFVTGSLSEDYYTGISLSSQGYQVIYLGERLSAGLSAENMTGYITQRLRWARGTLQAFFMKANPLTVPGIKPLQRLAHLEGIFQWFTSVFRVIFLLMPVAYTSLGIVPIRTTVDTWLYYFIPFYLLQLVTFSWLNYRSRSAIISDIYNVVSCFPISLAVIQTLLNPFSETFKVTPKGISSKHFTYNWTLAFPLIIVFILNLISFGYSLNTDLNSNIQPIMATAPEIWGIHRLAWIWCAYNLLVLGISLQVMLDVPKHSSYEWFNLRKDVRVINSSHQKVWGVTKKLSEVGAEIELNNWKNLEQEITLEILGEGLELRGRITKTDLTGKLPKIQMQFEQVSLPQYRQLVEIIFCRPGRWQLQNTPGELHSLWLLFKILIRPLKLTYSKITKTKHKVEDSTLSPIYTKIETNSFESRKTKIGT